MDIIDSIINEIEELLFEANFISDKEERHDFIQDNTFTLLRKYGLRASQEYKIKHLNRFHGKESEAIYRRLKIGAIDIYGILNTLEIGVEFDSKKMIKWISLEKLCQSDANICFFLVLGPDTIDLESVQSNFKENKKKLHTVIQETIEDYKDDQEVLQKLENKRFWLGVVRTCLVREIPIDYTPLIEEVLDRDTENEERDVIISSKSYKKVQARILDQTEKSLFLHIKDFEQKIWVPMLALGMKHEPEERGWQEIELQRWFLYRKGLLKDEEVLTEEAVKRVVGEEKWDRLSRRAIELLLTTLKNYLSDILSTAIELTEHSKRKKMKEKDITFADELIKLKYEK